MPLLIDDKRLIPAPTVGINKQIVFTDDGRPLSSTFRFVLRGTLLPNRGSPGSEGWFYDDEEPPSENFVTDEDRFNSLLAKQELLREALTASGFKLTYYSPGYDRIVSYPRLISLNFDPGVWAIRTDYTIDLEASELNKGDEHYDEDDYIANASGLNLKSAADNWQIKERDNASDTFEVSRNVSAAANTTINHDSYPYYITNVEPWQNAKTWVDARLAASGMGVNSIGFPTGIHNRFNMVEEVSVDKFGGTYSVAQRYIYHSNNYKETRSISRNTEIPINDNNSPTIERINVNGVIEGLDAHNNPTGKVTNALSYWNTIKSSLGSLVGAYGSGITTNFVEDYNNGTINYTVDFINYSGSIYTHNYVVTYNISDAVPSVNIQGEIQGLTSHGLHNGRFTNATTGWNILEPTLRTLAFAQAANVFNNINSSQYGTYPTNKNISFNKANGLINYNYGFAYKADGGSNYNETYSVELDTANATSVTTAGLLVNARINGTIQGLTTTEDPTEKLTNAESAWSTIVSGIYTRVNSHYSKIGSNPPTLNSKPVTKALTVDRSNGAISYSFSFNNYEAPPAGIAVMDIVVDEQRPGNIVAVQQIPGRAAGPILQNISTISEYRRTINVALTMLPSGTSTYFAYGDIGQPRGVSESQINSIVSDIVPTKYRVSDSENWNWRNGVYSRSVTFIYASG